MTRKRYEERIVAFIDILGFASKIKNTSKGAQNAEINLRQMVDALDYVHNHFNELKIDYASLSLQLSQFSDSIVISTLKESSEIIAVFKNLKYIQIHLLSEYNILLRGGIVKGELIHTNDLLLGPAMVNAYSLESKCALSPRIVIDPSVILAYQKINKTSTNKKIETESIYKKDFDGAYYIDYFNNNLDFYAGDEEQYFRCLCQHIKAYVNSSDISIRMKYLWMRAKLKKSQNFKKFEEIYREVMGLKKQ